MCGLYVTLVVEITDDGHKGHKSVPFLHFTEFRYFVARKFMLGKMTIFGLWAIIRVMFKF